MNQGQNFAKSLLFHLKHVKLINFIGNYCQVFRVNVINYMCGKFYACNAKTLCAKKETSESCEKKNMILIKTSWTVYRIKSPAIMIFHLMFLITENVYNLLRINLNMLHKENE